MTSQIIFPKEPTYWILSDGASYYDGLTPSNCVTTVGAGTTVYWIGTNHQEYVQACLDLGITPRNPSDNPLVAIDPASPASFLNQKINELTAKIDEIEKVSVKPDQIDSINSTIVDMSKSQEESVVKIENDISVLSAQQQETVAKLDPIVTNIPNERISATQARLWLINNNIDLALVYSIIDNIPDEQSKKTVLAQWEYSPYIERSHPWLQPLADILQIDLDVVFREAINL
jgi:hypothetical protein